MRIRQLVSARWWMLVQVARARLNQLGALREMRVSCSAGPQQETPTTGDAGEIREVLERWRESLPTK
jgi:hypothetical protein